MDIHRIISELVQERSRLERIIRSLEDMSSAARRDSMGSGRRPGRKSMDQAAREEVSERMKRYWAQRRVESSEHNVG